MNCKKCNYDFGDIKINFCPNCGKKIIWGQDTDGNFRRIDYLRLLTKDQFLKEWETLSVLDANSAYQTLFLNRFNVSAWAVKADYIYIFRDCEGNFLRKGKRSQTAIPVDEIPKLVSNRNCEDGKFSVVKINIPKITSPNSFGVKYFWTEEECREALNHNFELAKANAVPKNRQN